MRSQQQLAVMAKPASYLRLWQVDLEEKSVLRARSHAEPQTKRLGQNTHLALDRVRKRNHSDKSFHLYAGGFRCSRDTSCANLSDICGRHTIDHVKQVPVATSLRIYSNRCHVFIVSSFVLHLLLRINSINNEVLHLGVKTSTWRSPSIHCQNRQRGSLLSRSLRDRKNLRTHNVSIVQLR